MMAIERINAQNILSISHLHPKVRRVDLKNKDFELFMVGVVMVNLC